MSTEQVPEYEPRIYRKICLAAKKSPGEIFPPICRKNYGHTDHEHSSGHGVGISVLPGPITWANLGDSVFPEGEEEEVEGD